MSFDEHVNSVLTEMLGFNQPLKHGNGAKFNSQNNPNKKSMAFKKGSYGASPEETALLNAKAEIEQAAAVEAEITANAEAEVKNEYDGKVQQAQNLIKSYESQLDDELNGQPICQNPETAAGCANIKKQKRNQYIQTISSQLGIELTT